MPDSPPPASRILIIRPSALGDVARSVCVLASLRASYPSAQIDWVVRDAFAPVIAHHPALSSVVLFPQKEITRAIRGGNVGPLRRFARVLREARYDLVFECQGLARSGAMAWVTRAKVRVGYADGREAAWLALTHRVRTAPGIHSVDKTLALLEAVGVRAQNDPEAFRLFPGREATAWLGEQEFARGRYTVLAPTSAWRSKEWPAERFAGVASHLVSRGERVVIVAAKSEVDRLQPFQQVARERPGAVVDLAGKTDVAQLVAVIGGAALVVANDSAAGHIAAGMGRPLVSLLGPTDPALICPYGREADVIQHVRPGETLDRKERSSREVVERISVEEVIRAVDARLGL